MPPSKGYGPVEVTIEIDGQELVAGTLWVHRRGGQSATFRYADGYLREPRAYELDPVLALRSGVFQTPGGKGMFNAFSDSSPDRWGQNLMRREERERAKTANVTPHTLHGADFLLGVRDDIRQGALRFRKPDSRDYFSSHTNAVPKVIELSRLLQAVDRYDAGTPQDRDLKDLIDAGGSLGGARPKAAVITHGGNLAIAKFPRKGSDDWDVIGWEKLVLNLAGHAGVHVAPSELIRVNGRNVLLVDRFERNQGRRIGFTSALTMLEASDGDQRSYVEIAEIIERKSNTVRSDLDQLYRRIVFSILTGNTDDHLRNHGFIRRGRAWALSPAYDINPNPDSPGRLSTNIDLDNADATIDLALSVAEFFRLTQSQARSIILEIETATHNWRQDAQMLGLPPGEVDRMTVAFDSDQRPIARALGAHPG